MTRRLMFAALTLFWVVMNVMLWRSEFGGGRETAADLPVDTVIERILNSADDSVLSLRHHGLAIGQLRWNPSVTERTLGTNAPEALPEGMVRSPSGHGLDLDLNLFGGTPSERWRVLARMDLETNHVWRTLNLRIIQRPRVWEFTTVRGEGVVRLRTEEGRTTSEQTFALKDFSNPSALLGSYAALVPRHLLPAAPGSKPSPWGFKWTARHDWLRVGRNRVRVYRLKAKLFERYEMDACFSRSGEVLRVSLPDNLVLVNEALPNLSR